MTNLGWRGYWSEFDYGTWTKTTIESWAELNGRTDSHFLISCLCGFTDRLTEKWWR